VSQVDDIRSEIIRLIGQRPFAPFTIVTATGARYEVWRKYAAATNGERIVIIGRSETGMDYSLMKEIDHIETSLPSEAWSG